jgi:hypothetical protein
VAGRKTLLVGSIPAGTAEQAMTQALGELGPHLRYLPDGETGERDRWVVSMVETLRRHPDLTVRREGRWADYQDQLNFTVRRGHQLRGDLMDFGIVAAYRQSWPVFAELRDRYARPDLAFQVGIPGDLDMALFSLGMTGPFRHRRPFTQALAAHMGTIYAEGGDQVLFQIEVPAELVFMTKAPGPVRPAMAGWLGGIVANLAGQSPGGSRFGVHLCLGDLGHQALGRLRDTGPLVQLANAICSRWPGGRSLEYIHAPLAAGEDPPPADPAFYRPLQRLALPERTRFVAGLLHEGRSVDELRPILADVESLLGRWVDVAAACGLGRRSPEAAQKVMRQGAALCAP